MHGILRTAIFALAAASVGGAEQARQSITADGVRAHLRFLSHDLLEGRAPGTRGGALAAEYIAAQFLEIGLRPVDGGYFQPVPLVGATVDGSASRLAFEGGETGAAAGVIEAELPAEAVVWPGAAREDVALEAELVFVGFGIRAPEWSWDDYAGHDVRGKVVLVLVGDPPAPPEEPELFDGRGLTYYGRWSYKLEEAHRQGAAGALLVHRTDAAGYGWDVVASSWAGEQFVLAEPETRAPLVNGWISAPLARRVIARSGNSLDELYVLAARRDFRPVRTGVTVRTRMAVRTRNVETHNVVGLLRGSDPDRAEQVVVFTSHYDHFGIGAPDASGDSIYNGAYDNASGVAVMLEVARAFTLLDGGPRRSLLFIATAAEEAGMLGSTHYVARPLVPLGNTVAALNVDGANLWGETQDVIALGADDSTLGPLFRDRAAALGLQVRPDPAPHTGAFFRSDHFPFARVGVPVLYLEHGLRFRGRPEGWGEERMDAYLRERYHQPGDEYRRDFDLSGAVQQARLLFDVGLGIADDDDVPRWNPDSPYAAARP